MAVIAGVILRHQRKAAELEGRLRVAETLANARQTSQSIVENAPIGVAATGLRWASSTVPTITL